MKSFIIVFIGNALALFIAGTYIDGFSVPLPETGWEPFLIIAAVFTIITLFLKPLLKALLSPIIFITFGLAHLLVTLLLLLLLEYLFPEVSITGLFPLIYATLLLSVIQTFLHTFFNHK
jgi:putative membrane protein